MLHNYPITMPLLVLDGLYLRSMIPTVQFLFHLSLISTPWKILMVKDSDLLLHKRHDDDGWPPFNAAKLSLSNTNSAYGLDFGMLT